MVRQSNKSLLFHIWQTVKYHFNPRYKLGSQNNGSFHLQDNILYHQDTIKGQTVDQPCVPQGWRKSLLYIMI